MCRLSLYFVALAAALAVAGAEIPSPPRTAPPAGIRIAAQDRERLGLGSAQLGKEIESLRARAGSEARVGELLPDVEILHKAVDWALRHGEFTPPDTLVLHPYGRFCNAFKFAGETDVFEALAHAQKFYPVDTNRLAVRGFSMGGAGTWHLAAHHPEVWAAAAPGAGFAETADYTGALAKEPKPPWYEQKLWHLCDATDYALNLLHVPTIAYSGEIDKQKRFSISARPATRSRRPSCRTSPCSTSPCPAPSGSHAGWRSRGSSTRIGDYPPRPARLRDEG